MSFLNNVSTQLTTTFTLHYVYHKTTKVSIGDIIDGKGIRSYVFAKYHAVQWKEHQPSSQQTIVRMGRFANFIIDGEIDCSIKMLQQVWRRMHRDQKKSHEML